MFRAFDFLMLMLMLLLLLLLPFCLMIKRHKTYRHIHSHIENVQYLQY